MIGRAIGPYQVVGKLGEGGMGEVYRARDARLGRDVAIKILPPAFTGDPDRLARFEREARVLAALSHPNIGTIYGVEESGGIRGLVLELVDGDTLADRVAAGPLPVDHAIRIAAQIADALDAAHEKGIVHRDLKPANVKITGDGVAKVLDFGLAKTGAEGLAELSQATTAAVGGTRDGIILGTVAYMSPEQARGQPVDKRTDIWAFGCVLYEMLAGRSPFAGETTSDTIAAILERDPDWSELPAATPAHVTRLVRRCLDKDPKQRLRDIGDARLELRDLSTTRIASAPAGAVGTGHRLARWIAGAFAVLAAGGLGYYAARQQRPNAVIADPTRFGVELPLGAPQLHRGLGSVVMDLSPDGRHLAFFARAIGQLGQLWIRSLDQLDSRSIPGTEGGFDPFFSPDGRWIGFFQGHQIKKVLVTGGEPLTICDMPTPNALGATWAADDTILFTPSPPSGLWRVAAAGGIPAPALEDKDVEYRWPQVLPNGKAVLFTTPDPGNARTATRQIYVQSLETRERHAVIEGAAGYVADGYLVFMRANTVLAAPFDLGTLETTGEPLPLVDRVLPIGRPVSISRGRSLAYIPAIGQADGTFSWVSRSGAEQPLSAPVRPYLQPRLAPDGRQVAVTIEPVLGITELWTYDLQRDVLTPLTSRGSSFPVWTPDGHRLTFQSAQAIYWKAADGSGPEDRVWSERPGPTMSWAPDGRTLAFIRLEQATLTDIWLLPFDDRGRPQPPRPFVNTRFREGGAVFSPDGRWIAYVSNETGRNEVYVRSIAENGPRQQISIGGGNEPVWPRNGRELFYRNADVLMAVDLSTRPTFTAGKPRPLFKGPFSLSSALWANYDATADGQRFLMIKPATPAQARPQVINVILNWPEELRRRVGQQPGVAR